MFDDKTLLTDVGRARGLKRLDNEGSETQLARIQAGRLRSGCHHLAGVHRGPINKPAVEITDLAYHRISADPIVPDELSIATEHLSCRVVPLLFERAFMSHSDQSVPTSKTSQTANRGSLLFAAS